MNRSDASIAYVESEKLAFWRVAPGDRIDVECSFPPQHLSAVVNWWISALENS